MNILYGGPTWRVIRVIDSHPLAGFSTMLKLAKLNNLQQARNIASGLVCRGYATKHTRENNGKIEFAYTITDDGRKAFDAAIVRSPGVYERQLTPEVIANVNNAAAFRSFDVRERCYGKPRKREDGIKAWLKEWRKHLRDWRCHTEAEYQAMQPKQRMEAVA